MKCTHQKCNNKAIGLVTLMEGDYGGGKIAVPVCKKHIKNIMYDNGTDTQDEFDEWFGDN